MNYMGNADIFSLLETLSFTWFLEHYTLFLHCMIQFPVLPPLTVLPLTLKHWGALSFASGLLTPQMNSRFMTTSYSIYH